jgi:hypothetical protein
MPLPKVHVKLTADGNGEVWLNDQKIPAVIAVDISGAVREQPTVTVTVIPGEVTVDLPETGVQLIGAGPSLADFVERLNPARLEALALEGGTLDVTAGEAFAAAVAQLAAEFEQATGD